MNIWLVLIQNYPEAVVLGNHYLMILATDTIWEMIIHFTGLNLL